MNEDDKLVIDAMARMGELAIRGEADKALIAELVEALEPFAGVPIDMMVEDEHGSIVPDDTFTSIEVLGIGGAYQGVVVSHFRRAQAILSKAKAMT